MSADNAPPFIRSAPFGTFTMQAALLQPIDTRCHRANAGMNH